MLKVSDWRVQPRPRPADLSRPRHRAFRDPLLLMVPRNPGSTHQLRLVVVFPMIYYGFQHYPNGGWEWDFSHQQLEVIPFPLTFGGWRFHFAGFGWNIMNHLARWIRKSKTKNHAGESMRCGFFCCFFLEISKSCASCDAKGLRGQCHFESLWHTFSRCKSHFVSFKVYFDVFANGQGIGTSKKN